MSHRVLSAGQFWNHTGSLEAREITGVDDSNPQRVRVRHRPADGRGFEYSDLEQDFLTDHNGPRSEQDALKRQGDSW